MTCIETAAVCPLYELRQLHGGKAKSWIAPTFARPGSARPGEIVATRQTGILGDCATFYENNFGFIVRTEDGYEELALHELPLRAREAASPCRRAIRDDHLIFEEVCGFEPYFSEELHPEFQQFEVYRFRDALGLMRLPAPRMFALDGPACLPGMAALCIQEDNELHDDRFTEAELAVLTNLWTRICGQPVRRAVAEERQDEDGEGVHVSVFRVRKW